MLEDLLHRAIVVEGIDVKRFFPRIVDIVSRALNLVDKEDGSLPRRGEAKCFLLADWSNHEVIEEMPLALLLLTVRV